MHLQDTEVGRDERFDAVECGREVDLSGLRRLQRYGFPMIDEEVPHETGIEGQLRGFQGVAEHVPLGGRGRAQRHLLANESISVRSESEWDQLTAGKHQRNEENATDVMCGLHRANRLFSMQYVHVCVCVCVLLQIYSLVWRTCMRSARTKTARSADVKQQYGEAVTQVPQKRRKKPFSVTKPLERRARCQKKPWRTEGRPF